MIKLYSSSQLVEVATGRTRGSREWAWECLLEKFEPMMHLFVPTWAKRDGTDEDWLAEYRKALVMAVKNYRPGASVRLSTFVASCFFRQRASMMMHQHAAKRDFRKNGGSLNEKKEMEDGPSLFELLDFLVDSRKMDPETHAAFAEFICDVDSLLEPNEIPVWRWLVQLGGDVEAVAMWMRLPVKRVAQTYRKIRWTIRNQPGSYNRLRGLLAALELRSSPGFAVDVPL